MFITCGMYMDLYYNLGLCVCVYKKSFFFYYLLVQGDLILLVFLFCDLYENYLVDLRLR